MGSGSEFDRALVAAGRGRHRHRLRRWVAAMLVLATCAGLVAAGTAVWARRTFLDSGRFAERVGPLGGEPAMQAAVARIIGDEAVLVVDARRLVDEALPERGRVLAGPISAAVEQFLRDQVDRFVASRRFARLWTATVSRAHQGVVAVVEGRSSEFASAAGGRVTLNLVPIINAVLAEVGGRSPEILGLGVRLPSLTVEEAPEEAVRRLEAALGVDLRDGYGELTVFDSRELAALQGAVETFEDGTALLVLATLALGAAALWVTPNRRRTLLQLCAGAALGMLLVRRASYFVESSVLDGVVDAGDRAALALLLDALLDPLRAGAHTVIALATAVALAAVLSGPYPWAVRLRAGTASAAGRVSVAAARGARGVTDAGTIAWLQATRDRIRIGEAVVLGLALLLFHLPWGVLLLMVAVAGTLELLMARTLPGA